MHVFPLAFLKLVELLNKYFSSYIKEFPMVHLTWMSSFACCANEKEVQQTKRYNVCLQDLASPECRHRCSFNSFCSSSLLVRSFVQVVSFSFRAHTGWFVFDNTEGQIGLTPFSRFFFG